MCVSVCLCEGGVIRMCVCVYGDGYERRGSEHSSPSAPGCSAGSFLCPNVPSEPRHSLHAAARAHAYGRTHTHTHTHDAEEGRVNMDLIGCVMVT